MSQEWACVRLSTGVRHGGDVSGWLTQVTNPQGLSWSYAYDSAGRLIAEKDFDDRTLTHDPAGHLTSRTNALGQVVAFERNELGQVIRKDASGQVGGMARRPPVRRVRGVYRCVRSPSRMSASMRGARSSGVDAARQSAPVSWRKSPGSASARMVPSFLPASRSSVRAAMTGP